jgi:hypothetical protein
MGELNIFGDVNKIQGDTQQIPQNIKMFSGSKTKIRAVKQKSGEVENVSVAQNIFSGTNKKVFGAKTNFRGS